MRAANTDQWPDLAADLVPGFGVGHSQLLQAAELYSSVDIVHGNDIIVGMGRDARPNGINRDDPQGSGWITPYADLRNNVLVGQACNDLILRYAGADATVCAGGTSIADRRLRNGANDPLRRTA